MSGNRGGGRVSGTLDDRLLGALRRNSRESCVELARMLGTSEGTVRARLKKLTDAGAISAFTIRTAMKNVKAIIDIKIDPNINTVDISTRIARIPGIEEVFEVSGDRDIVAIAETGSTAELNELIEKIRKIPRTQSTWTRLILRQM